MLSIHPNQYGLCIPSPPLPAFIIPCENKRKGEFLLGSVGQVFFSIKHKNSFHLWEFLSLSQIQFG